MLTSVASGIKKTLKPAFRWAAALPAAMLAAQVVAASITTQALLPLEEYLHDSGLSPDIMERMPELKTQKIFVLRNGTTPEQATHTDKLTKQNLQLINEGTGFAYREGEACYVFPSINADKEAAGSYKLLFKNPERKPTPEDFSTFVLLHELAHCNQPLADDLRKTGDGTYVSTTHEAGADGKALKTMAGLNPASDIVDTVVAARLLTTILSPYESSIALDAILAGQQPPTAAQNQQIHSDYMTIRKQLRTIQDDNPPQEMVILSQKISDALQRENHAGPVLFSDDWHDRMTAARDIRTDYAIMANAPDTPTKPWVVALAKKRIAANRYLYPATYTATIAVFNLPDVGDQALRAAFPKPAATGPAQP